MNISLPDPMRDYGQDQIDSGQYGGASDYIRRDQAVIADDERWLRALDASLAESLAEMAAGGGIDLDAACEAVVTELNAADGQARR